MKRYLFLTSTILFFSFVSLAQTTYQERVMSYVQKYQNWAMLEQIRSGVPASITLAQGILETAAGESELSINANNHFGIKCKSSWKGLTYTYTDDAKDECFRQYDSAYHSYVDHSDFLRTNPRYASLFLNSPLDYKSWAIGLKKAGYATNPHYATKLIKFIEEYKLAEFTLIAMNMKTPKYKYIAQNEEEHLKSHPESIEIVDEGYEHLAYALEDSIEQIQMIIEYYVPTKKNYLKGFYAKKGDLLLEYALKKKIRYSKLLMWNDLQDQPLQDNIFIYTESKRKKGIKSNHVVKSGETLHIISQEEGIQIDQLLALNLLNLDDRPVTGSVLNLQEPKTEKIQIEIAEDLPATVQRKEPALTSKEDAFISINHEGINQEDNLVAEIEKEEEEVSFQVEMQNLKISEEPEYKVIAQNTEQESNNEVEKREVSSPKENQSPLEKLKAYMDNTVYQQETEIQTIVPPNTVQSRTTLPAAQKTQQIQVGKSIPTQLGIQNHSFYIVKKGDTAFSIAKRHQITLTQLKTWNQLPASMVVSIGEKLKVKP